MTRIIHCLDIVIDKGSGRISRCTFHLFLQSLLTHAFALQTSIGRSCFQGPIFFFGSLDTNSGTFAYDLMLRYSIYLSLLGIYQRLLLLNLSPNFLQCLSSVGIRYVFLLFLCGCESSQSFM